MKLVEVLKIAGTEGKPVFQAMEHILKNEHIDLLIKSLSRIFS